QGSLDSINFLTEWVFVKNKLESLDIGNKYESSAVVLRTAAAPSQQSEASSQQSKIAGLHEEISALLGSAVKVSSDLLSVCETSGRYLGED
ncbi:MAG: hypothetical protein SGPRY_003991, partial [Prymnesium sp.]